MKEQQQQHTSVIPQLPDGWLTKALQQVQPNYLAVASLVTNDVQYYGDNYGQYEEAEDQNQDVNYDQDAELHDYVEEIVEPFDSGTDFNGQLHEDRQLSQSFVEQQLATVDLTDIDYEYLQESQGDYRLIDGASTSQETENVLHDEIVYPQFPSSDDCGNNGQQEKGESGQHFVVESEKGNCDENSCMPFLNVYQDDSQFDFALDFDDFDLI